LSGAFIAGLSSFRCLKEAGYSFRGSRLEEPLLHQEADLNSFTADFSFSAFQGNPVWNSESLKKLKPLNLS
jgi:hypothetical protein